MKNSLDEIRVDISLNPRINSLEAPKTTAVNDHAKALADAGVSVISLSAGEPHFDSPLLISEVLSLLKPFYLLVSV